MTIGKFAEKYNLDKRNVDYFTNLGIFHPKGSSSKSNSYRDYDERCEKEAKIVVICLAAGMNSTEMSAWLKVIMNDSNCKIPDMMKKFFIAVVKTERAKAIKQYDDALAYIEEF